VKQVLVDSAVVWEQEVAGGTPGMSLVEVPLGAELEGKQTVSVTLRVLDNRPRSRRNLAITWSEATTHGLAAMSDWTPTASGRWQAVAAKRRWPDPRWVFESTPGAPKVGDFAEVRRMYHVRGAGRLEGYSLRLACDDDYYGSRHRRCLKQILIDGAVVWEQDLSGGIPGMDPVEVPLDAAISGKSEVLVTLRVLDWQSGRPENVAVSWTKVSANGLAPVTDWTPESKGQWRVLPAESVGRIVGSISLPDGSPVPNAGIRVQQIPGGTWGDTPSRTGPDGRYRVWVPPGKYRVTYGRGEGVAPVEVSLGSGSQSQRVDFLPLRIRQGELLPAGPGRSTEAYAELSGGLWQSFVSPGGYMGRPTRSLLEDSEGNLWFLSEGVHRYDGDRFTEFSAEDGLLDDVGTCLMEDQSGSIWFGTGSGVVRYDGASFTRFTAEDGMAGGPVSAMLQDREGDYWFAGLNGVNRYNGRTFAVYSGERYLGNNWVRCIYQCSQGDMWFGTDGGGASRYDGQEWAVFTTQDGLAGDVVRAITEDAEQRVWLGTWGGGLRRHDGSGFTNMTRRHGLVSEYVLCLLADKVGTLWIGTSGKGLARYDGTTFQSLQQRDGIPGKVIEDIQHGKDDRVWIATDGGISVYHPVFAPPVVEITNVTADRRYGSLKELRIPTSQRAISFEYKGASVDGTGEGLVYQYRLWGYDDAWRQTRKIRVEYTDLHRGEYRFEVRAVDRDLLYSDSSAEVQVVVHPPYAQVLLAAAVTGLVLAVAYGLRKRRVLRKTERALLEELEEELQTAHDLQMGLMPDSHPSADGFEIAGRCLPANHVGGDFYKYFRAGGTLTLVLADVTGHAMDAAIPVVMFSGVLDHQMETSASVEQHFERLNASMHRALVRRTFVCFAMGQLDPATRTLRLSNAGCPYPYHFRAAAQKVSELPVGGYPLGVRPDTAYEVLEVGLEPQDRVIFCSDGIIEADNAIGEQFGYERTAETIRQACEDGLSAEATIDALLQEVATFKGDAPQSDDMACVVVRVEKHPDEGA